MRKYGKGWFLESRRHALARQGVKTGRKNYAKDVSISGITYEPTTVGAEKIKEEEVMKDVDGIVAETKEERFVTPEEEIEIPQEELTAFESEVESELSSIEAEHNPLNVVKTSWGEKVGKNIKKYTSLAVQAAKDLNIRGIDKHVDNLKEERIAVEDKINVLKDLKTKISSSQYKKDAGLSKQLSMLKRINKLAAEPHIHLRKIDRTVTSLEARRARLEQKKLEPKKKVVKGLLGDIFPTFGEILHPERLRKK